MGVYCLMTLASFYLCMYEYLKICFDNDMGDSQLTMWTTKPGQFFVAALESKPEKVLGCVAYKAIDSCTVEVGRMSVAREARRLGLAKRLMENVIKHASQDGYTRVYLTTSNGQAVAIELYKKMGFEDIGREPQLPTPISKHLTW